MADENTNEGGASYSYYPILGDQSIQDVIIGSNIPNYPDPPPVTSSEINQQTNNQINTAIQPVIQVEPPTGAQVLNNAVPPPTAPPPVTNEQILGQGIQNSPTPPPVSTSDFNQNVNQSSGGAGPNPTLNGDSNLAGGTGLNTTGNAPGTSTYGAGGINPGGTNVVDEVLAGIRRSSIPYNQLNSKTNCDDCSTAAKTASQGQPVNQSDAAGRRVRLRAKPGGESAVYGCSPLLNPIKGTNGMLWPYQPLITYTQEVDYKPMELTHANQDIYAYHRTPSLKLMVDGEFSVQNQQEGLYAMACIHFLRVVSKMHFGEQDRLRGTPPPVLLFDAYGQYMFSQLPVIVTGFTVGLPKDVDYVPVDMSATYTTNPAGGAWRDLNNNYISSRSKDNIVWLPAVFNIQVNLIVQNSPTRLRQFDLNCFRNGVLLKQGGWV